jgi:hypothetical protein
VSSPFLHGVARVVNTYVSDGVECHNVFHVADVTGTATDAEFLSMLSLVNAWWSFPAGTGLAPRDFVSHEASLIATSLLYLSNLTGVLSSTVDDVAPLFGSVEDTTLPNNCTKSLEWRTGNGRRCGHGRVFLMGMTRSLLQPGDASMIDPAQVADLEVAYTELPQLIELATAPPGRLRQVVFHRVPQLGTDDPHGYFDFVLDAHVASRVVNTQRRRLPG